MSAGEARSFENKIVRPKDVPEGVWKEVIRQREHAWAAAIHAGIATSDAVARSPITILDRMSLGAVPEYEFLVEGVLVAHDLNLMFGPSGSYKSFVALDLSLHIAAGIEWHGRRILRTDVNGEVLDGPVHVVYIAAEGASGILQRVEAWEKEHPEADTSGLHVIPHAINLYTTRPNETEMLLESLEIQKVDPVLVVFDTQARCTVGASESDPGHMNIVVDNLINRLMRRIACAVLVLHHSDKADKAERGTESIRNASGLVVRTTGDVRHRAVKMVLEKVKERAMDGEIIRLDLVRSDRSLVLRAPQGNAPDRGLLLHVFALFAQHDESRLGQNTLCKELGGNKADTLAALGRLSTGDPSPLIRETETRGSSTRVFYSVREVVK